MFRVVSTRRAPNNSMTSAMRKLSITAHCNSPCTQLVQPLCRKRCCPTVRDSTRRKCSLVCGSTETQRPFRRLKQASGHGPQVADQPVDSEQQTPQALSSRDTILAFGLAFGSTLLQSAPAIAFTIHQEPENALSFPTWVIHISSVIEWAIAMSLVWKYAEVTGTAQSRSCQLPPLCSLPVSYCQTSRRRVPQMQICIIVAVCSFSSLCVQFNTPSCNVDQQCSFD